MKIDDLRTAATPMRAALLWPMALLAASCWSTSLHCEPQLNLVWGAFGFERSGKGYLKVAPTGVVKFTRGSTYFTKPIRYPEMCVVLVLQVREPSDVEERTLDTYMPQMSERYALPAESGGDCSVLTPYAPGIQATDIVQAIWAIRETQDITQQIKGHSSAFKVECTPETLCPGGASGSAVVSLLNPAHLVYASLSPWVNGVATDEMVYASVGKGEVMAIYVEAHRTLDGANHSFRGRMTALDIANIGSPSAIP